MAEMRPERRYFTRVALALPVEIHQGGSVWHQSLIDISLNGVTTDRPADWDAQYNELFTLIVRIEDNRDLELHAYLQHVSDGRLGFTVQHVDRDNLDPLRAVLEAHMDITTLEEELRQLGD